MAERTYAFAERAQESLAGAEIEFANRHFNNTANRAYYATFQAAIVALQRAGVRPQGDEWSHRFVRSQFDGLLVNRRKLYPVELRGVLTLNAELRVSADYDEDPVAAVEAERALRRSRTFVQTILPAGNKP